MLVEFPHIFQTSPRADDLDENGFDFSLTPQLRFLSTTFKLDFSPFELGLRSRLEEKICWKHTF
jgi:hypothetical protein